MDNYLTVESLKSGDKFEFLTSRPEGAKPEVMVVTRAPAVNPAANSCHFRYQPDDASDDASARWNENQSWNGTPGVKVRILSDRAVVVPPTMVVVQPTADETASDSSPVTTPQKSVAESARKSKRAESATPVEIVATRKKNKSAPKK